MSGINPQGYSYGKAPVNENPFWEETPASYEISATAEVDENTGTPSVTVETDQTSNSFSMEFKFYNLKGERGEQGIQGVQGEPGEPGQDGRDGQDGAPGAPGATGATPEVSATAQVDSNTGTPSVSVQRTGTDLEPVLNFYFHNLKGEQGVQGIQGVQGVPGQNGQDGTDGTDGITPTITATAQVDNTSGTPTVTVQKTGTDANPNFDFSFSGLKGASGGGGAMTAKTISSTADLMDFISDNSGKLVGIQYLEVTLAQDVITDYMDIDVSSGSVNTGYMTLTSAGAGKYFNSGVGVPTIGFAFHSGTNYYIYLLQPIYVGGYAAFDLISIEDYREYGGDLNIYFIRHRCEENLSYVMMSATQARLLSYGGNTQANVQVHSITGGQVYSS